MTAVVFIINTIIWIAAWMQCARDGIPMLFELLTNRGFGGITITSSNALQLMTQKKGDEIVIVFNQDFSRNKITETERNSRLIAKEKETQRLLRWRRRSLELLKHQKLRRSFKWIEDMAYQSLALKEILGRLIAMEAETRRLLQCIADNATCVVCMEQFATPAKMTTALCTGKHVFHKDCMVRLQRSPNFQRDPKCPICRDILLRSQTVTGQYLGQGSDFQRAASGMGMLGIFDNVDGTRSIQIVTSDGRVLALPVYMRGEGNWAVDIPLNNEQWTTLGIPVRE